MTINDVIKKLEGDERDNEKLFLQKKSERENYYSGQIDSLSDIVVDEKQKSKVEEKKNFLRQNLEKELQLISQEKQKIEDVIHAKLHLILELKTQNYEIVKR